MVLVSVCDLLNECSVMRNFSGFIGMMVYFDGLVFFESFVCEFLKVVGLKYVVVCWFVEEEYVEMIVFWLKDYLVENFCYLFKDIFCEGVFRDYICIFLYDVVVFFLKDEDFVVLGVEFYVVVRFFGFDGEVFGMFWGIYDELLIEY